ncbi:MAG: hypothetical protein ACOZAJ_04515 [Patescibacteria group bacterium]
MVHLINQQIYEIPLVFVQGDRDPEGEAKIAATRLGNLLKENGWGVSLGAYGGFVKVLEETGVPCLCHETEIKDHGDVKFKKSPYINFKPVAESVSNLLGGGIYSNALKEISWANRLGTWMATSQAYCFFAGREGTLAHLIPVLSFNAKSWTKTKPRKVALIGWNREDLKAIMHLYNLYGDTPWFMYYDLNLVDQAVNFLIS